MGKTWSTHGVIEKYILQSHKKITVRVSHCLFFSPLPPFWCSGPCRARATSLLRFRDYTHTHTALGRTPLEERSARRRDLYLTTQHWQETNIHTPGGIRTHNPSKRTAADPRLKSRGLCYRRKLILRIIITKFSARFSWLRILFSNRISWTWYERAG